MSRVPYREAVGALNYLSVISRPDITYAVSQVSRFCDNPGFTHWSSVKRIMRYLKGTMNYEAVNGLSEEFRGLELVGFCDSDWAGEIDSRGSTGGFIFKLNGGPVSWSSRLQKTSALSSTETDDGGHEGSSLVQTASERTGSPRSKSSHSSVCRQSRSNFPFKNAEFHKRTKYISVQYRRIRQKQEKGEIKFDYIDTRRQAADFILLEVTIAST